MADMPAMEPIMPMPAMLEPIEPPIKLFRGPMLLDMRLLGENMELWLLLIMYGLGDARPGYLDGISPPSAVVGGA